MGQHLQVRPPAQAGIEGRGFDERPNMWKVTLWMGQPLTQNRRAACTWSHQSQQQANGGRLPGTIGANKASDGGGRYADGEAIDCFALPEALTQSMGFDRQGAARRHRHRLLSLRCIRVGGHDHLHKNLLNV